MMVLGLRLYQFIVVGFSAAMMLLGIHRYFTRQIHQTLLKLAARLVIWGGMAVVALFPSITNKLAGIIGLEGNINAVILTGFLLVFLLIFKMLSIIERIEQDISELTRRDALKEIHQSPRRGRQ